MTELQAPWRSLLFVPGARPDRFEKAASAGADLTCIDLEDAVAPGDKDRARQETLSFLAAYDGPGLVGLRVNAVGTKEGEADLTALKGARGIAFCMVPKAASAEDMSTVAAAYGRNMLIPVLESARGIQRAAEIADHEAVTAGVYGAIDLSADIGCSLDWEAHLYGRSACALAFGAARKVLFDTPYLDVKDPEGLRRDTLRAKGLGLSARAAIHPAQLGPIHEALSPTAEEIAHAKEVVAAFDGAKDGVALLNGKLIELPVIKSARRVLALAERAGGEPS
jgi:(S)-citramalyl-CoA lyase